MPPKKSDNADGPPPLTESELRFIKAVFDNMTQKPDADWDRVATSLSLKDAKCAKERWRQMSVRHGWRDGGSASGSPRKATSGGARTSGGSGSPAKVAKKPRTPRKKVKKEEDSGVKNEESDEDFKNEDTADDF